MKCLFVECGKAQRRNHVLLASLECLSAGLVLTFFWFIFTRRSPSLLAFRVLLPVLFFHFLRLTLAFRPSAPFLGALSIPAAAHRPLLPVVFRRVPLRLRRYVPAARRLLLSFPGLPPLTAPCGIFVTCTDHLLQNKATNFPPTNKKCLYIIFIYIVFVSV